MNLARSSVKLFAAKSTIRGVGFLAVVVFSRELGAAPLGTYYPFVALLGLLAIPADWGIRSATEKRLSEGADPRAVLGTALAMKVAPLLAVAAALALAREYVAAFLGADLLVPLVLALAIRQVGRLGLAVLRGELRVGETALARALRPIGWLVVGYALVSQGYGVAGLVWGYVAGLTATALLAWWRVAARPGLPSLATARSLFEYGRYSVVSAVGGYVYSWMDVAVLTAFVAAGVASSRAAIGAYENAWRLSLLVMPLSQAIATTLFPQISRWDADGATDRIEAVLPRALLPPLLVVVPAFAVTAVLARDLLAVLFGAEFAVAWLALVVLAGEKVLQSVHIVLGKSLQAIDRPDLAAAATVVSVLVNLALNVALIYRFGIAGAAVATAASFTVNTALHARYLGRFLEIRFPTAEAAWIVVAAAGAAAAVAAARSVVAVVTVPDLALVLGVGAVVYGALVLASRSIRRQVRAAVGPAVAKRIP